mgnify:CR=1 FL=1
MRTLRTAIMGASMVLPGMFLALLIWYIAGKPTTEPLETLICNVIPMISIVRFDITRDHKAHAKTCLGGSIGGVSNSTDNALQRMR